MQVVGYSVLGDVGVLKEHPDSYVAVAFSVPAQKQAADEKLQAAGVSSVATLVHPGAWISRRVLIGEGCIIYPGVHIDVDVSLGRFVLLNKVCTVGHDTVIGDYVTAAPAVNLGGNCRVGKGFEFGVNSATIQNLTLGEWSVLGAGGVAVKSLDARTVYAGVPAKVLRAQGG